MPELSAHDVSIKPPSTGVHSGQLLSPQSRSAPPPLPRGPLAPADRPLQYDLPVIETVFCDAAGAPGPARRRTIDELLHRAEMIAWMRTYMRLTDRR